MRISYISLAIRLITCALKPHRRWHFNIYLVRVKTMLYICGGVLGPHVMFSYVDIYVDIMALCRHSVDIYVDITLFRNRTACGPNTSRLDYTQLFLAKVMSTYMST